MDIALVGFGSVGKGVAKVFSKKQNQLKQNYDLSFSFKGIFTSKGAFLDSNGLDLQSILNIRDLTAHSSWKNDLSFIESIDDLDVDLVIEVTPTNIEHGEPGKSHIISSIKKGCDVVTANKGPLVVAFNELNRLAKRVGCILRYEGSVGGGIPVFNLVRETLQGNTVHSLKGILNGTSNFILTQMTYERTSFESALKTAQELGYAEADPTADVGGFDAASKTVILANGLFGMNKGIDDIYIQGITKVTPEAIELAKNDNFLIKHICSIEKIEGEIEKIEVAPRLIPITSTLAVNGTLNVVSLQTDLAKEITIIGRGAGGEETASAILSDVVDIHLARSAK
jgi:homoserine dehydrogenase